MIRFHKILPYSLLPTSGDTFEYLNEITTQRLDVPTLHSAQLHLYSPVVFLSPLKRSVDCVAKRDGQSLIMCCELREIPFSIKQFCSSEEWEKERSKIIRMRFIEAFIQDQLSVSRAVLEKESRMLLDRLAPYDSADVVSHSFRLACIEGYLATSGELFRHPELIRQWIQADKKRYEWGRGFDVPSEVIRSHLS